MRRHQDEALRLAYLAIGDAAEAEDAVQDGFVKAYYALSRFHAGASFRPWLLRIIVNEARNRRKARRRRAGLALRAVEDRSSTVDARSPETVAMNAEQHVALLSALDSLRDEERLAIVYRYFSGLSESEMIATLGWPRGTVKSRLSRALRHLREYFTEQGSPKGGAAHG